MSSIQNALCPLCGTFVETVNHLLFTCMVSWKLWTRCAAFCGISLVLHNEPGSYLEAWYGTFHSSREESIWQLLPFAVLWSVWLFMNDIIFAGSHLDFAQLFFFLVRLRPVTWFKAKNLGSVPSVDSLVLDPSFLEKSRPSKAIDLSKSVWSAPPVGFLKMNVDGAMLRDGSKGGIRAVLKDNVEERLASFCLPLGSGPPILAELEAICQCLKLFFSINEIANLRLILECDSAIATEWIFPPSLCPSIFSSLVRKCYEQIKANSVFFRLVPRSCNLEADALAKEGIG
ncbi:hypothetical protein V6N12_012835 [Hibiscus sabdariffa]|uniref:RNase H type-1 domain-containing protein n=1 Tax=Hibiscus sabdariffa TaxID=183260 RepID=A0ABR2EFJ7_9ROSI